jgi:hypothetical protein
VTARRPTPTVALVSADTIKLNLDLGAGVRLLDGLSVGLTFQWGIAHSRRIVTYTHPLTSSDGPSFDARSDVEGVTDAFLPGGRSARRAGARVTRSWRSVIGRLETGARGRGDFGVAAGSRGPSERERVDEMTLHVPQQTKVRAAVRWAMLREQARLRPRSSRRDPLADERFDLELDAVWELNSRVDAIVATPREGSLFDAAIVQASGDVIHTPLPVPVSRVEKHWRDQLTLHLGGDWVIAPTRFAVRAGLSYETRASDLRYLTMDFMPLQRLGVHLGGTVRLGDVDFDFAYAHIFQETVTVAPEQARFEQLGDGLGEYVNAGTYSASWNLFSLGATWRL